jgi:ComF family protein
MLSSLRHWTHRLLAHAPALLPSACALCGCAQQKTLCDDCRRQYFQRDAMRCRQCALPITAGSEETLCGECLQRQAAFDATIAAVDYAAPLDQMVLALKFRGRLEMASPMADMIRDAALRRQELTLPTLLAPVPLGPRRLVERGFNQALEIARPLSRSLGVSLAPRLLVRERDTHAQSLLHPEERSRNVQRAFIVSAEAADIVRGAHVGMVDDVMTTGDTLNEIAATLKRFGAARVTNFVFARTLPN